MRSSADQPGVLVAVLLPYVLAMSPTLRSYAQLRALGDAGMHHLLVAKNDLLPRLAACPTAVRTYTLQVQRQAGTFYPLALTIHPVKGVAEEGSGATNVSAVIGTCLAYKVGKPASAP
jgi:hypothetical protein